jgi:hypothetical protein
MIYHTQNELEACVPYCMKSNTLSGKLGRVWVKHCPYCGTEQCHEDKCSHCGSDYSKSDTDGRWLDLKYFSCVGCGKEIGGSIRYSEETGEPLPLNEMLNKNNYEKEITDWFVGIYNAAHGGYITCYDRMLYKYDQLKTYTSDNFTVDFYDALKNIFVHRINDFVLLRDDENLYILSDKERHSPKNYNHYLCVIDIWNYDNETYAHDILNKCKGRYKSKIKSYYYDRKYELDMSFVFISGLSPDQTKIGSIYDKCILIVTPVILGSVDIAKMWQNLKEK